MWLNLKINLNSRLLNAIDIRFKVATATDRIDGPWRTRAPNCLNIGFIGSAFTCCQLRKFP